MVDLAFILDQAFVGEKNQAIGIRAKGYRSTHIKSDNTEPNECLINLMITKQG